MTHRRFPSICICLVQLAVFLLCHIQAHGQQRKIPPTVPALQEPIHVPRAATLLDGTQITLRLAVPVKVREVKYDEKGEMHLV